MRPSLPLLTVLAAAALIAAPAQAQEALRLYDNFGAAPLDPARWGSGERVLAIRGGALNIMQRTWGLGNVDGAVSFSNWNETFSNPAAITAIRARINVTAIEVGACPASTVLGQSRARIVGGFFNVGTPVPGSQVGDVIAQVRLTRFSNSTDPAGVLRVQGIVSQCASVECNQAATIGNIVDLGTAQVGTPTVVQMRWDQGGKSFFFSRDQGAYAGSVGYALPDTSPPSVPFKQLSTRLDLPSCLSGPRVAGMVDARFDNVAVNASAAP